MLGGSGADIQLLAVLVVTLQCEMSLEAVDNADAIMSTRYMLIMSAGMANHDQRDSPEITHHALRHPLCGQPPSATKSMPGCTIVSPALKPGERRYR
jgi:hypothetical protein